MIRCSLASCLYFHNAIRLVGGWYSIFQGLPGFPLINCSNDHFNVFINKNLFTIRLLDTSHHSMEDVIRVIAITLETLLEDKENQIRYVVVLDFSSSFQGILFRGLSCIVDASNLSLAHMTFWNPIEVQNYKNWFNTITKTLARWDNAGADR